MKPFDVARRLEECAYLLAAGEPLPPSLRSWLPPALLRRVREPKSDLDRLLGLRSRAGGRGGYVGSPIPERNRLIQILARGMVGTVAEKAYRLAALARADDPAVAHITRLAPIPGPRQLQRIIADDMTPA